MKKPKKRIGRISGGLVLIPILILLLSGFALAEPKHWIGGASDWNSAGNWDPDGVPVKGDAVLIDTQGDMVSYNNDKNPTLRSLQIDDPTGGNIDPTLRQNALTLTTEKTEIGLGPKETGIGPIRRSFYNHLGGVHRILIGSLHNNTDPDQGNLHLGVNPNSIGVYDLQNAVLSVAGHEKVGILGEGYMSQMGGTAQDSSRPTLQCTPPENPPPVEPVHTIGKNLYLGLGNVEKKEKTITSYGQFNIDAGSLTVGGSIRVGNWGTGQFNHTGSTVTVKGNDPDSLENGLQGSPSDGSSSSGSRMKNRNTPPLECQGVKKPGLIVGLNNKGVYNLDRGILKVNSSAVIGYGKDSSGSDFSSRFIQDFGIHKISGDLIIARYPDLSNVPNYYPNSYTLNGASLYDAQEVPQDVDKGLLDVGGFASVGHLGFGEFYQEGGSVKVRGSDPELKNLSLRSVDYSGNPSVQCNTGQRQYIGLTVGRGGIGAYWMTDGELLVSRGEAIGVFDGSDGAFYHSSGSHYVGGVLTVALLPGSKGLYELVDGLLVARGGLINNDSFRMFGGVLQAKVTNNSLFLAGKPAEPLPGQTGPTVSGDFYNRENARLTLDETKVKFGPNFYNSGIIDRTSSTNSTTGSSPTFKNLTINPTGFLTLGMDKLTITGNLINKSAKPADWHTEYTELIFAGPGNHNFKTGSQFIQPSDDGAVDGRTNNFAWAGLTIEPGAILRLQGHLYAEAIHGIEAENNIIKNMFGFCGIRIYYDPDRSDTALEGGKLFTPWGKQIGIFQNGELVPTCQ
ncbi:MAG: hypothetical protein HY892_01715 [Deltaproteobacteria bacterium]|nr:hypothetical protein [Deltaproteobacteria bacterium]